MPNRIIRESILTSRAVNQLSADAEVFYRRLMSIVDDYGRYEADADILLARLYPLQLSRTSADKCAQMLAECGHALTTDGKALIETYNVNGRIYLQLTNFGQRTRTESKFPSPCGHLRANDGECPPRARATNTHTHTASPPSEGEKESEKKGKEMQKRTPITDPGWFQFREQAPLNGVDGSSEDWRKAEFAWGLLDGLQQIEALAGLLRDHIGKVGCLPQNYLQNRIWERPARKVVASSQHRNAAATATAAERFLRSKGEIV
jgi:hypothetical protein